jgi:hypothetical protein
MLAPYSGCAVRVSAPRELAGCGPVRRVGSCGTEAEGWWCKATLHERAGCGPVRRVGSCGTEALLVATLHERRVAARPGCFVGWRRAECRARRESGGSGGAAGSAGLGTGAGDPWGRHATGRCLCTAVHAVPTKGLGGGRGRFVGWRRSECRARRESGSSGGGGFRQRRAGEGRGRPVGRARRDGGVRSCTKAYLGQVQVQGQDRTQRAT